MKILILGLMGAGKSTLAYNIQKRYGIARLNIDEVCRNKDTGEYYTKEQQLEKLKQFEKDNAVWVMEGSQKYLYEKVVPDLVVYIKVSRLVAAWRFTLRFFKAKKLIGKQIDSDLPVQAYHYRKPTLKKIMEWDTSNGIIQKEINSYLKNKNNFFIVKNKKDFVDLFKKLDMKKA